jgi:DNA-binding transcriptional LysR family regulator
VHLEDLQTFVELADAGGISAAARRLGLSKSAVSRRLARLEEDLGVQLLARSTRGAALTEAGSTFREHARRILAELDAARETIHPNGNLRGRLRITVPVSFGTTHLAPVLAELARRYPQLHIHATYSDSYVDLVGEGFDAGIRVGYLADSSLVARKIGPVRAHVVASPDYLARYGAPETPEDLLSHEVLLQATVGGRPASVLEAWRFLDGDKPIIVHPHGRFMANNGVALSAAALAGVGIALMPDFLVDSHLASGALVPLLTKFPVAEGGIYILRPAAAHPSRKLRALIEIMREFFGPHRKPAAPNGREPSAGSMSTGSTNARSHDGEEAIRSLSVQSGRNVG